MTCSTMLRGAFALLALPGLASAATLHVSPAGSDAGSCTAAAPCREIRRALALVHAGDTILVADGTYRGFDVRDLHGTAASPIVIQAAGTGAQVLPTTDRPDNRDTIFVTFSSHVVIDGLRSSGANRAAVRIDQSPNVTVRRGVFGNNARWGIFTDFSDDLLLEDNECFGSVAEHGIYVSNSGDRPVLRANRVHDNAASGIQLNADLSAGGDGLITGALIEKNVLWNNGALGGAAINLDGVQDSTVRNNILYGNHATGIVCYGAPEGDGAAGPRGMDILHNTVDQASDARYALLIHASVGPNRVRNNVLHNRNPGRGGINYGGPTDVANTDSDFNVMDRMTPDDSTVLTLAQWQAQGHEPHSRSASLASLFVNANAADYHLAAGSPALDHGETLPEVVLDFEDQPRPQGGASDIGAYEAAGGVSVSIGDVSIDEGNAGTVSAVFTLSLSSPASQAVTVGWSTADGTATAGADYVAGAGTLTFPAGATSRTLGIAVNGDALAEADETFFVELGAAVGAAVADGQGRGTIRNDDTPAVSLAIADAQATEGNSGSTPATFVVTLSGPASQPVTVDWLTVAGTAKAGTDYAAAAGTLSFAPGVTTRTLGVAVLGDTLAEVAETFKVNLSNPAGATLADASGKATILDNDGTGALQFSAATYAVSESVGQATVTVSRSGGSAGAVSVAWATSNGTAVAPGDYTARTGTLTFAPGVTSKTFTVAIKNDTLDESTETIGLTLSAPGGGGTLGARTTALVSVADDDTGGTLSFSQPTYSTGEGAATALVTVSRSGGLASGVTVKFATSNGTATAGQDYGAKSGTLSFGAGVASRTFTVALKQDTLREGPETIVLTLSAPTGGAVLGAATATLTIEDDEPAP